MEGIIQDLQEVLARLQKAGEDVWNLVDKCSPFLALSVEETDDPVIALKHIRNVHATAVKICGALQTFADSWNLKTDGFAVKTDSLGLDIDSTARHRVLSRLPDELLVDILDHAACFSAHGRFSEDSLKFSVQLSHVCKHFRRVLVCSSEHWTGQTLKWNMPLSIILILIERCDDGPFKAEIEFNRLVEPDSEFVRTILDLGVRLDDLTIIDNQDDIPPLSYPEPGHALSPRTLTAYHCLPHISLLRNVVNCSLDLGWRPSLKDLLEFLSSADKLEVLALSPYLHWDNVNSLAPISLPSLTTLRFDVTRGGFEACLQFMEKIVPFTASSPSFKFDYPTTNIGSLFDVINAWSSVRDLRLESQSGDLTLPSIPRQIETLELSPYNARKTVATWLQSPELFPAQSLRLLKFSDCDVDLDDILRLRDMFVRTGCDQARFGFEECYHFEYPSRFRLGERYSMKNGTYELADVDNAAECLAVRTRKDLVLLR